MRYFILFILLSPILLLAQNAQEVYGKNKVQYNRDQQDWWIYETSNFVFIGMEEVKMMLSFASKFQKP